MRALAISTLIGAVALTGCTTDPTTGQRDYNKAAIGAVLGSAAGYGVSKGNANTSAQNNRAAAIGAVLGGAGGYVLDQKEKKLREQLAGSGVDVGRNADGSIGLVMPGNITFPTNSYSMYSFLRLILALFDFRQHKYPLDLHSKDLILKIILSIKKECRSTLLTT